MAFSRKHPVDTDVAVAEPPRPSFLPARSSPTVSRGSAGPETKRLVVGRDIVLSGQITNCDRLVVEGRVEAQLSESAALEIADSGRYVGNATITDADIGGVFEGDLTVLRELKIRATGRVYGRIRYGQIDIEAGGQISGTVSVDRSARSGQLDEVNVSQEVAIEPEERALGERLRDTVQAAGTAAIEDHLRAGRRVSVMVGGKLSQLHRL